MEEINIPLLLSRWLHLLSAIILVGGSVFLRFALMPAAADLPTDQHDALRQRLMGKWKILVHVFVVLLFLTGMVNLIAKVKVSLPIWHMLFGIKFLLALVVIFFAHALVGRSKGLQPVRDKAPLFLVVNIVLATLVVLLSGVLNQLPKKPANTTAEAAAVATE